MLAVIDERVMLDKQGDDVLLFRDLPLGHLYDYILASNFLVPLEIPEAPKPHD